MLTTLEQQVNFLPLQHLRLTVDFDTQTTVREVMIRNYTVGDNQNYRSLETRVIQRIVDVDGSKWDKWFGISATRETNIVKIERDILAQYYSMVIPEENWEQKSTDIDKYDVDVFVMRISVSTPPTRP